ncbi:MAG: hypothetical protein AB8I08_36145 [Sandaracinaceae bacterium]
MSRTASLLAAAVVLLLAQPAPGLAQANATQARALFGQGVAAMDRGDPATATGLFSNSYQAYPRASTACNLALALERTSRLCEAHQWYQQCATMDSEGRFPRAAGNASALSSHCQAAVPSPFVSGPRPTNTGGRVQVVEGAPPPSYTGPGPDHTLLGVGLAAVVLGAGAIVGGGFAAGEATYQAGLLPPSQMTLTDPRDIETYDQARTFSNVALGLYVGGAIIAALGVAFVIADLLQPGVFGGSASRDDVRWALVPLPDGGAAGAVRVSF